MLKNHKSSFKQLVKKNSIRMGSDVSQAHFEGALESFEWFTSQPSNIKVLLFEYYIFKIRHKEQERELKLIKKIADFLRRQAAVKLTKETVLQEVASILIE